MNITYLIGNGFDINIGMKTRYTDFYKYYLKRKTKNPFIMQAKQDIKNNYENWADLEVALGNYTSEIESQEDFIFFIDDICKHLAKYLENEELKYVYDIEDNSKFLSDLCFPENYLEDTEKPLVKKIKDSFSATVNFYVNIITFNYTKSMERLLPAKKQALQKEKYYMGNIQHIHGFTDDRMIIGVDEIAQIKNESFREKDNIALFEQFVKPLSNQATKRLHTNTCIDLINNSNLICLFGMSIGETDTTWWQKLGTWLIGSNKILIIFSRGQEVSSLRIQNKRPMERKIRELFLSRTTLSSEQKNAVKERILVVVNAKIFKIKLKRIRDINETKI